jgi:hypothetical protein
MPIGTTFSEAADLVRRNVFALVVIGAIVFIPLDFIVALLITRVGGPIGLSFSLAVSYVGVAIGVGASIAAIAIEPEGSTEEPRTPVAALRDALVRWQTLLAIALAMTIGVGVGVVAFVIPGVVLLTWWFVSFQPALIESRSWQSALGRSRELVRGRFWAVFLILTVNVLVIAAARFGVIEVAGAALPTFLAAWASYAVTDTVTVITSAALTTATYWQLRAA